ncbi:alpha-L RNA-binding motif-containing protein [Pterulicium gracile]|uniref:Alpha-L RNA-binding motif-containing protein n=1 Tax=Pterulicium gracile TaxID=1884261 RepID=A0A5C3Q336_9AGAR|nr:alpha-L RNA-binding motif-containing protein [Pterula gracilis]
MRDASIYSLKRAFPRMSWHPKNLYNLYQRCVSPVSPPALALQFRRSNATIFQQRWASKAAVRAYHGDYIPEKIFKRWYLPDTLPDTRPKRKVNPGDDKKALSLFALRDQAAEEVKTERREREEERKGMAPVGSLMFREVERRLDVVVFRACLTHSVYEARRLVIHGRVMINGKKHNKPNTRLAPGDLISVDPSAVRLIRNSKGSLFRESDTKTPRPASSRNPKDSESEERGPSGPPTFFSLPSYAAPWLFVPAYIEPHFKTCSAVYVRHPTARPGYSEIPTPYNADGDVVRFAWEWYTKNRPRLRSKSQLARMPLDRALHVRNTPMV